MLGPHVNRLEEKYNNNPKPPQKPKTKPLDDCNKNLEDNG